MYKNLSVGRIKTISKKQLANFWGHLDCNGNVNHRKFYQEVAEYDLIKELNITIEQFKQIKTFSYRQTQIVIRVVEITPELLLT